jgi:hypothetical protein
MQKNGFSPTLSPATLQQGVINHSPKLVPILVVERQLSPDLIEHL